jgi:glutathione S-transferase
VIKLYYHPLSTFSRRVHMALLEKGLPFELVTLDMPARQHKSPEYLALNPYGRVPTLVETGAADDGGEPFVLYESTAILEYVEATHPEPPLVPPDARGRALVAMHMKLADVELGSTTGTLIFPKRFLPKEKWNLAAMEKAREGVTRHLGILDKHLAGKTWLVGEAYSLADLSYTPFAEFFGLMEVEVPANVAAWAARVLARPSAAKTKPAV